MERNYSNSFDLAFAKCPSPECGLTTAIHDCPVCAGTGNATRTLSKRSEYAMKAMLEATRSLLRQGHPAEEFIAALAKAVGIAVAAEGTIGGVYRARDCTCRPECDCEVCRAFVKVESLALSDRVYPAPSLAEVHEMQRNLSNSNVREWMEFLHIRRLLYSGGDDRAPAWNMKEVAEYFGGDEATFRALFQGFYDSGSIVPLQFGRERWRYPLRRAAVKEEHP